MSIVTSCSRFLSNYGINLVVEKIIDGDTFEAFNGRHRILGIDTPETFYVVTNKPTVGIQNLWGNLAKEKTTSTLFLNNVEVESLKKDKYDRWISRVTLSNGIDFASYMISSGYAVVRYISSNPNNPFYYYDKKYIDLLNELQAEAKSNKKGFWSESLSSLKKIFPNYF